MVNLLLFLCIAYGVYRGYKKSQEHMEYLTLKAEKNPDFNMPESMMKTRATKTFISCALLYCTQHFILFLALCAVISRLF